MRLKTCDNWMLGILCIILIIIILVPAFVFLYWFSRVGTSGAAIPGFPVEGIVVGVVLALVVGIVVRRRRKG